MNESTFNVTLASLIKYVGKVYRRSFDCSVAEAQNRYYSILSESHDMAGIVGIMKDDPCFDNESAICNIACEIVSPNEIFKIAYLGENEKNNNAPLYSVFNRLNTVEGEPLAESTLKYDDIKKAFLRTSKKDFEKINYNYKWNKLSSKLRALPKEKADIEKYLRMMYDYCSDIPLSNEPSVKCDLSLYDFSRLCAAFASSLYQYSEINGFDEDIASKNTMLLYSADFTGIQSFIYGISEDNALKTLRAKSFFVEMAMENLIDEILNICGLSRANLLYSGGGHCYLILPNTQKIIEDLNALHKNVSVWAAKSFGSSMCIVWDIQPCSANDFMNKNGVSYSNVFTKLSSKLANRKLQKYSPDVLLTLNEENTDKENRECRICGKSSSLIRADEKGRLCEWCNCFIEMSNIIMGKDTKNESAKNEEMYFAVLKNKTDKNQPELFSFSGESYLAFMSEDNIDRQYNNNNIKRIYCKNHYGNMSKYNESRKIFVCSYQYDNQLNYLSESAMGIKRLGVLRMDVDNLGNTFVSGFKTKNKNTGEYCSDKYMSIARTAALSHILSVFFKQSLTEILKEKEYKLAVIYSGGDDVFLVGAWNDVIAASQDIIAELSMLSDNKLTASGGIGIYDDSYPIAAFAVETESLEKCAKDAGKNSIALFEDSPVHTYKWKVFSDKVQNEKLNVLNLFLKDDNSQKGMSFLYKLLDLLRACSSDKINIARIAYLLAKMCSEKGIVEKEQATMFSNTIYNWVVNDTDRKQLITAINIYVYSERKET